ncbi:hypothetical protein DSO57_1008316 [Entomophthora muscae]|uniref:Uncharacterized protein n=1 Tax=Entomophthora muscae TaxID=34485 RepID=A0ACC2RLY5_9FUNG|nr:hypothetical protein DSO57_1008316 [Entomophthora muscae]
MNGLLLLLGTWLAAAAGLISYMKSSQIKPTANVSYTPLAPELLVQEIKHYLEYAATAYCSSDTHQMHDKGVFQKTVEGSNGNAHAQVYLNKELKQIVISFRGANNLRQFFKASGTESLEVSRGKTLEVHKYVYSLVESIRYSLYWTLSTLFLYKRQYRLVLVGHSLGGAMATLMAPILSSQFKIRPSTIRIITYNSPRVGNKHFALVYNKFHFNFTRVVNKDDPVPSHPPSEENWAHVHQEVYINHNNHFLLCSTESLEDASCSFAKSSTHAIVTQHNYIADQQIFHKFSSRCSSIKAPKSFSVDVKPPVIQSLFSGGVSDMYFDPEMHYTQPAFSSHIHPTRSTRDR